MSYDPKKHHRRSIRLKGYDYSQEGLYFITLCVQHKECLFGHIVDHQMVLNDAGNCIEKWVDELKNKYPGIDFGEYVVMPNHFHCIIEILSRNLVEKGEREIGRDVDREKDAHTGAPQQATQRQRTSEKYGMDNKQYNATIGDMMDWFKTMSTNEYIRGVKTYNWKRFDRKLWQVNYWEHIIRNQLSYESISGYSADNPTRWRDDQFYRE